MSVVGVAGMSKAGTEGLSGDVVADEQIVLSGDAIATFVLTRIFSRIFASEKSRRLFTLDGSPLMRLLHAARLAGRLASIMIKHNLDVRLWYSNMQPTR